ncbi:MAG: PEGA domain-containing protein [Pyrinomonadaceae bacterium]
MKRFRYDFLFVIGLILTIGLTTALAAGGGKDDENKKRPKNTGVLSVKTSPEPLTVKVDGQVLGMSGVNEGAEFYLTPGFHTLEVEGPNGKTFVKQVEIRKDTRNCVCLKIEQKTEYKACPYNVSVDGPDKVLEGDLITFASVDALSYPTPLNYVWTVSPSNAKITSGLGTSAITVDTAGLGGQTISAEVDVSDGLYAASCRQILPVSTVIEKIPPIESILVDKFESKAFDDDKARLDNFVIELQNNPDAQAYIIMYQGTDRESMRTRTVDKLSKKTMDYLVNTKGVDPRRIVITQWGNRPSTEYELWLIPPGAPTPVPQGS